MKKALVALAVAALAGGAFARKPASNDMPDVARPEAMTVEYYNENFEKVTEHFDKFACRMIQHEMSHLDGKLFTDLVAPIRKKIIGKKLQSIAKGKVSTRYNAKIK